MNACIRAAAYLRVHTPLVLRASRATPVSGSKIYPDVARTQSLKCVCLGHAPSSITWTIEQAKNPADLLNIAIPQSMKIFANPTWPGIQVSKELYGFKCFARDSKGHHNLRFLFSKNPGSIPETRHQYGPSRNGIWYLLRTKNAQSRQQHCTITMMHTSPF